MNKHINLVRVSKDEEDRKRFELLSVQLHYTNRKLKREERFKRKHPKRGFTISNKHKCRTPVAY